jgi:RNA recognition motif-containing protein
MSAAGAIHKIYFVSKGSANVVYNSKASAAQAVAQLNQSTIAGNSRYIDVIAGGDGSMGKGGGGAWFGGGGGKGGGGNFNDPPGSGRVLVRGFDFDTSKEQVEAHMSAAGAIHQIFPVSKGSANVVYEHKASAVSAVAQLNQSTIEGNSRYIDVILGGI